MKYLKPGLSGNFQSFQAAGGPREEFWLKELKIKDSFKYGWLTAVWLTIRVSRQVSGTDLLPAELQSGQVALI
jgi:hypothetical protein